MSNNSPRPSPAQPSPTRSRAWPLTAWRRFAGIMLAAAVICVIGYCNYIYLNQEYAESISETVQAVVEDVDDALNTSVREANERVRSLEALLRSSENVEQDELIAFASVTRENRLTIVKSYGWLPFDTSEQALIVNDHVRGEKLAVALLNPQARDLIELGQTSPSTMPDAMSGGLMPGESENNDLVTILRRASIEAPGRKLAGAFFVTYSLRRIVALSPLPPGSTISEVDLRSKGTQRTLLVGRVWDHKTKPEPVLVDFGGPNLRVLVQAPQRDFLTYVQQEQWQSQATLLAVILAVLLNSYLNIRQIALGRKANKVAALAAEAAQQAGYQKTRFLATMSHEMRTPLNGIIGMADLLLDSRLDDTQRKNASTLSSSAQNLLALINQILDFSKIEAKEVQLDTHDVNLGELLTNVTNAVGVLALAKRVEMVLVLPIEVCATVKADSMKLRQILTNLMSNAIKFTSQGSVTLQVERIKSDEKSARFRFTVRDTGIGIASDRIASIFAPFEQADISTTRAYGGTGLGLTITRDLVEAMGGKIEVSSTVGVGSAFSFELDLEIIDDGLPLRRERCVVGIQNILLAMPSSERRKATQIAINSVGGECQVIDDPAQAGAAALAAQRRNEPYDLILVEDGKTAKAVSEFITAQEVEKLKVGIIRSSVLGNHPAAHQEQAYANLLINAPHTALTLTQGIANAFHHRGFIKSASNKPLLPRTSFKGLRVLLVDDDPVNQYYGVSLLEKIGCVVTSAGDGQEAIDIFGDGDDFDVIFMDCQMPVMDGLTATRELRKRFFDGKAISRPIVALTANSQPEDQQACFAAGMKEFLSKPVRQAEVIDVLAKLAPDTMRVGPTEDPEVTATSEAAPELAAAPPSAPSSTQAEVPQAIMESAADLDLGSMAASASPVSADAGSQRSVEPENTAGVSTESKSPYASAADQIPSTEKPAILGMENVTARVQPSAGPTAPIPNAEKQDDKAAAPSSTPTAPFIPEGEVLSIAVLRDTRDMLGANFTKLLQTFVDAAPTRIGSLDFDIDARNYEEVRRNAHSLKSSAKMVGALAMSNAALRLEEEARKPNPNRQEALAYSSALSAAYRGFLEKLQQLRRPSNAA